MEVGKSQDLFLFYPPSDPQLLKTVSILLTVLVQYDNKFMVSEATKCVVIRYSNNWKLIQQAVVCLGKEFNLSIMESLEGFKQGANETGMETWPL